MSFHCPDNSKGPGNPSPPGLPEPGRLEPSGVRGRVSPVCPRCQVALQKTDHQTGMAWRCTRCGGQSLNFSQFRRLIPECQANDIWLTVREQPVKPQPAIACPECRQAMAAVLVPFEGREIELDLCTGCQRLWMVPQENLTWSLDEKPVPRGEKPPVISLKGRGTARSCPSPWLSGLGKVPAPTGKEQETGFRLWFFLILLAVLWLLKFWPGP